MHIHHSRHKPSINGSHNLAKSELAFNRKAFVRKQYRLTSHRHGLDYDWHEFLAQSIVCVMQLEERRFLHVHIKYIREYTFFFDILTAHSGVQCALDRVPRAHTDNSNRMQVNADKWSVSMKSRGDLMFIVGAAHHILRGCFRAVKGSAREIYICSMSMQCATRNECYKIG